MKRIVILEPGYRDYEEEKRVLAQHDPQFTVVAAGAPQEEVRRAVAGADAIMLREAPLGADLLSLAKGCAVVVRYGVGVDNIDLEAAKALGIKVANVPDYGSDDVAEHALALMLAATRRIVTRDRDVRAGKWNIGQAEPMPRIAGKNLGVLGFGRIARRFLAKASGLGFAHTYVTDPILDKDEAQKAGFEKATLEEMLSKSDFISVHVPLTKSTRHMIGEDQIRLMRRGAVVVNAGRG
ncbi:MAG: NAD(P)-dependent oxidoreductase, partial [Succinivibrio sp.]